MEINSDFWKLASLFKTKNNYVLYIVFMVFFISCRKGIINNETIAVNIIGKTTFYKGINNKVSFQTFGVDSVIPYFNEKPLERENNYFRLNIPDNYTEKNSHLFVRSFVNNKEKNFKIAFDIEELIPYPTINREFSINDSIPLNYYKAHLGISIFIPAPSGQSCGIMHYNYNVIRKNEIIFNQTVSKSPYFSNEIHSYMDSIKIGDIIFINEIDLACINKNYNNVIPVILNIK